MGVVVVVGTDKGGMLLRADDSRERFELGELEFRGWRVTSAARDPGGRTYVAVATETFGCALMASDDLEHWEHLDACPRYKPGEPGNLDHNRTITFNPVEFAESVTPENPQGLYAHRHVDQIWKLHAAGDVLYAGVSEAGLFRSDDRGKSWEPVAGLNDHPQRDKWMPGFGGLCLHSLLTDPGRPERIWAGISSAGVYRSDDGGATFVRKVEGVPEGENGAVCVHGLANDPSQPEQIFGQFHEGVFRSTDGGDHWERIENGLPLGDLAFGGKCAFGFPITLDPHTRSTFAFPLAGDDFRYAPEGRLRPYATRDRGDSWRPLEGGLPSEPRFTSVLRGAMAVDGLDPCGVYFGTTSGHVFASADSGQSWRELPCTLPKILSVDAFAV